MQHNQFISVLNRLALLSAFCIFIQFLRMFLTGTLTYIFLPWNLLLAWVPVFFAIKASKQSGGLKLMLYAFAWLIFFPNAPYIITDLIHLKPRNEVPLWFDAVLLYSFAFTGLITGIISSLIIYKKMKTIFPIPFPKAIIILVMFLSGYGIYLGRCLEYNSWDIITNPINLLSDTANRLLHPSFYPRTYAVALITGILLSLIFFIFESFAEQQEL